MSEEPKSVVYYELRDTITQLRRENEIMKKALEDVVTRGKGVGGAVVVTMQTLRDIAKEALRKLNEGEK